MIKTTWLRIFIIEMSKILVQKEREITLSS